MLKTPTRHLDGHDRITRRDAVHGDSRRFGLTPPCCSGRPRDARTRAARPWSAPLSRVKTRPGLALDNGSARALTSQAEASASRDCARSDAHPQQLARAPSPQATRAPALEPVPFARRYSSARERAAARVRPRMLAGPASSARAIQCLGDLSRSDRPRAIFFDLFCPWALAKRPKSTPWARANSRIAHFSHTIARRFLGNRIVNYISFVRGFYDCSPSKKPCAKRHAIIVPFGSCIRM